MRENKACRVRPAVTGRGLMKLGNPPFDEDVPERGFYVPYPKDCPVACEDYPLPGEVVVDYEGSEWTVLAPPRLDSNSWWLVGSRDGHVDAYPLVEFPDIWSKRKDTPEPEPEPEPEVDGTVTIDGRTYKLVPVEEEA